MKIINPIAWAGEDLGDRQLVVSARERAILLRAADILERGHALIDARNPDHQGDYEDLGDALCMAPTAIRNLCSAEGIECP